MVSVHILFLKIGIYLSISTVVKIKSNINAKEIFLFIHFQQLINLDSVNQSISKNKKDFNIFR
jgi:hypothetical protein